MLVDAPPPAAADAHLNVQSPSELRRELHHAQQHVRGEQDARLAERFLSLQRRGVSNNHPIALPHVVVYNVSKLLELAQHILH